jgi:hypothetical protein
MLYIATAIDPLPSARYGGHEAVSAMEFPPLYVRKTEKNPQLVSYPTPRPLTRDVGPTPLDAQLGGEWEQSVGSHYRKGMALTIDI